MAVGGLVSSLHCCWSTARSTTNGWFFDRWEGRSTGRSTAFRAMAQRSTARPTGPFPESRHSLAVDRVVDRPWPCMFCASVDRPVDLLKPGNKKLGFKTWSFWLT